MLILTKQEFFIVTRNVMAKQVYLTLPKNHPAWFPLMHAILTAQDKELPSLMCRVGATLYSQEDMKAVRNLKYCKELMPVIEFLRRQGCALDAFKMQRLKLTGRNQ
jgi:hypothetical protein